MHTDMMSIFTSAAKYDTLKQRILRDTVASLTGFELDQLQRINVGSDEGIPVKEAQPSAARSHSVRVDNAHLERTACKNIAKIIK